MDSLLDIHTHHDRDPLFTSIRSYHAGDLVAMIARQHSSSLTDESLYAFLNSCYSVGFHPMFTSSIPSQGDYDIFRSIISDSGCLAIGECGFDKRSALNLSEQQKVVTRQIEIGEMYGKPIVWHIVGGWNEILKLHKNIVPKTPWIVHGYRKGRELADQLLSRGIYLSFGEHYNIEALRLAYQSGLMLSETDESFLSIREILFRQSRNLEVPLEKLIGDIRKSLSYLI